MGLSFKKWLYEVELPDNTDMPAGQMLTPAQRQLNVQINQAMAADPKNINNALNANPAAKKQALADVTKKVVQNTANNPVISGQKGTNVGSVVRQIGHQINKMQPQQPKAGTAPTQT